MPEADDNRPEPPDWLSPDYASLDEAKPAVDTATDPPPPRHFVAPRPETGSEVQYSLARLAREFLDAVDGLADRIAAGLGLR
jgi:hypothetical protein